MTFFEVSPLCNFNVIESFTELSRIVLMRHGMEKIWRPNRGGVRLNSCRMLAGRLTGPMVELRALIVGLEYKWSPAAYPDLQQVISFLAML